MLFHGKYDLIFIVLINNLIVFMYQPDLSIVLPCYNEEKNIVKNVQTIIRTIKSQLKNIHFEIILVNDGSKDKTYESLLRAEKKFK